MGWQDSIVYDNQTPPPPATGWQSAIVYDNDNQQNSVPTNPNSFAQNPTLSNFGNAAWEAAKDVPEQFVGGLAHMGRMAEGKDPIITNDFGESANNVMNMVLPFMYVPEGAGIASAEAPEANLITPTSSDIKLIKQKLDLAGITPQQYADALMKSSPDDFAGEVGGDPLRMQTQAQAKVTGPAMQAARDAMRQRLEGAPQRTANIIEQTFFPSSAFESTEGADSGLQRGAAGLLEPVQQMQGNLEAVKDKLGGLYDAASATTVPSKPFLDIVNTPNGQAAMKATVERLANQNITPEQAGIVVGDNSGSYGLQPDNVPVNTMREVSKSLGGMVKRNPLTGAIEDPDSLLLERQRQQITGNLSQNSPEFNTANTNAAAQLQGQSAFETGRKLAHSTAGENADALMKRAEDTYSPQELSYHKAGYAQGLADMLQGTSLGGGNPAARIAKGTVQNATSDILQSPTAGQKFADMLMQEKNRVELAQRGLYGSNTAETLTSGVPEIPLSAHGLVSAALGKVGDLWNAGQGERMAQLLYATSPEQKALLAQKILK